MAKKDRQQLKTYFERGKMPDQGHFYDLIDSMLNLVDDGPSPVPPIPPVPPVPPIPPVPPVPPVPPAPSEEIIRVPADGKWHTLTEWTNSCRAYSLMAGCGNRKTDRYALIQAVAMNCFGNHTRITQTRSWYMFFLSRLKLRWAFKGDACALQIRTRHNYKEGVVIYCKLTELWGEREMGWINQKI